MIDLIKLLTSPTNWKLVISFVIAMALYIVLTDKFGSSLTQLPMQNILIPIVMAFIFASTFGIIFKQNAAAIFAVVLAFGLILENKDKLDELLPTESHN